MNDLKKMDDFAYVNVFGNMPTNRRFLHILNVVLSSLSTYCRPPVYVHIRLHSTITDNGRYKPIIDRLK